jgi:hypothetical protein
VCDGFMHFIGDRPLRLDIGGRRVSAPIPMTNR